ncbi:MAG: ATP-binding protein, partial [Thermodesulfovibrionales bacterium]
MNIQIFHSLKGKVLAGYLLGFLLMSGVILINLDNFTNIQSIVLKGEVVSELIDTILEVRRYEKNYFLYNKEKDIEELGQYLARLDRIIKKNQNDIESFINHNFTNTLQKDIVEYKELLNQFKNNKSTYLEDRIRNKGRDIARGAEKLGEIKKEKIRRTMSSSRNILIASIIFLATSGFIAGAVFYRMFAKSLILFENHMKKIADGTYSFIPVLSQDREMLSLSRAFNRMLVELELRQSHIMQTEKLASLGTLLFSVAHELNNPLNNISTSCQILMEEIETAEPAFKKELLLQIEQETDRARDIVRSILDYSKAGHKEKTDLNSLVTEAIRFIKAEIPPKVELIIDIPENISIFADPQQLKQVFLNLIKNSIEAMNEEGQIKISGRLHGHYVEIRLSDTGGGMSQEVLSRIFDPFFTTKEGRKGYGLGLFVTHNIIKEHGGTIDVVSTLGQGTT